MTQQASALDTPAIARGEHPFARRRYAKGLCPVAEQILDACLLLSINENYTKQDLETISKAPIGTADDTTAGCRPVG
jgi:hypothetical protein